MVSVMPPTGSDLNGPPLRVSRGSGQHLPVSYGVVGVGVGGGGGDLGYQVHYGGMPGGFPPYGYGYGQVLGSSGSSCHSTSSTEDSRVPNNVSGPAESSTGVVTRGKGAASAKVAPQKSMPRGKGKGKRIETKSVGKRAPSQGKGKGGKGRPASTTSAAAAAAAIPRTARSRGKNINNLPKTTATSYRDPPALVPSSRGKMMPPPPAPPVVQPVFHPVADWHYHHHQVHPEQHQQQYFLRRRPLPQRSVFDPSKGDGGPPRVRSFGPNSVSSSQSLFVDCSVEYELPTLHQESSSGEDNREPLLIIHPGWQHQQRITRSRSQQRLLEQQRWFRHQQMAMLQQQRYAAVQQQRQELYHPQFRPLVQQPQYPQQQPPYHQPYNPQSGPTEYSNPCCPAQVGANPKTVPSTPGTAAAGNNSRKRTFDQVTFSMAHSCQMGYGGGIMSDQHPIIRRANPSMNSNLPLGPTATKRAKIQSEQPKRKVCSCGLVLDLNSSQPWPLNCPGQPQPRPSPHKSMWNGMQLRSHPTAAASTAAATSTVTSGSSAVLSAGVAAAGVPVGRWNGHPPPIPGYYHYHRPNPHPQPVFNNNNGCPCCPNTTCVRYRSV